MPLQLEREAINFIEGGLAQSRLQNIQMLEMMRVIPIDDAQLQVGPILELACRELESLAVGSEELQKSLHSVKKSWRSVADDAHLIGRRHNAVGLLGKRGFVTVRGLTNHNGAGL